MVRVCRWDKPEAHVQDAVESRMRDLDLATERSLRVGPVLYDICSEAVVVFVVDVLCPVRVSESKSGTR